MEGVPAVWFANGRSEDGLSRLLTMKIGRVRYDPLFESPIEWAVDRERIKGILFLDCQFGRIFLKREERLGLKCNVCVCDARGSNVSCFPFAPSLYFGLMSFKCRSYRKDDIKALTGLGTAGASQRERVVSHRSFCVVSLCSFRTR